MPEPQAIEGYGCSCGYKTDDIKQFRIHMTRASLKDGKGTHKSIGRVNLITGDVVMPPFTQRTKEEQKRTIYGLHKEAKDKKDPFAPKSTDVLSNATRIAFVPRVYTADLSPIIQTAMAAANRVWGWREDMPLINFIDTVIYNFFKEHGVTLAAYVIETDEKQETEANSTKLASLGEENPPVVEAAEQPEEQEQPKEEKEES